MEEGKIPTEEELKEEWMMMSEWYTSFPQKFTSLLIENFVPFMQLSSATKVVEVACGPGNGIKILRRHLPEEVAIHASDLCPKMVETSRSLNVPNTQVIEANNESLPYSNEEFDRYLANLSLMLVGDADKMLGEAYRVLKSGGIAAFSIWGEKQDCTLFGAIDGVNEQFGVRKAVKFRAPYYLTDKNVIKEKFERAGFSKYLVYDCPAPLPMSTLEEVVEFYKTMPPMVRTKEANPELYEQCVEAFREKARVKLHQNHEPFVFAARIILAFKE